MSIILYQIPGTQYWIDEGYNLCDSDGTLYEQDGFTVSLDDWLDSLGFAMRRRQMPAYGGARSPPTVTNWDQIKWCWNQNGTWYGILDSYLFLRNNSGIPVAVTASTTGGALLYCKTNVAQSMSKTVPASTSRVFAARQSGPMPTTGVPANAFRTIPSASTCV